MIKWTLVFDWHEGSTMALKEPLMTAINWFDKNIIYGGDNIDLTGCKNKLVPMYRKVLVYLQKLLGDRLITGNHCAQKDKDRMYVIPGTRVAVMHGDAIFWGEEKSQKFRQKEHGAGVLKRFFWTNSLEALENGYDRKISNEDLERFYAMCIKYDVDEIYIGHLHCRTQIDAIYKGKTLHVCKRGITEIYV